MTNFLIRACSTNQMSSTSNVKYYLNISEEKKLKVNAKKSCWKTHRKESVNLPLSKI